MNYYAGIDLGGTNIKCGIADDEGRLLKQESVPTRSEKGFSYVAQAMAALVQRLARELDVEIKGIGVGCPGTIDGEKGIVVYSNNLAWKEEPLAKELRQKLQLPVRITNDANAAAYGEYLYGAGSNYKSVVMLTLGTGVGSGIVLDGKLFEGNCGAGAEFGHETIRFGGKRCTCGRRGCLEAYASATALIKQTRLAMRHDRESKLWEICGGDPNNVTGKTAFDGARAGDKAAKKVVENYIGYLAEGIANVSNALRPEAIVLGGGICAEGETLISPLKKKVGNLMFGGAEYAPTEILAAKLGNLAGVLGAVGLAKKYMEASAKR